MLFVINAGSNTLSMFESSWEDPTNLTLLGKLVATGGKSPVSVAVSLELGTVCVGHSAGTGGVSCAGFDWKRGLGTFDVIRPFTLNQSDPPIGPLNGLAQVLFTADSNELIAVVKGNGTVTKPSYFKTYSVDWKTRKVSHHGRIIDKGKTGIAFVVALIPNTEKLLVSTVSFGATIVDIDNLGVPVAITNITDQAATCWATVSDFTGTGFVDDVIVPQLTEVDLSTGVILKELPIDSDGQGLIDLKAVGTKVYALSPGSGIRPAALLVFDISGGPGTVRQIQKFIVDKTTQDLEGIGIFPNPGIAAG